MTDLNKVGKKSASRSLGEEKLTHGCGLRALIQKGDARSGGVFSLSQNGNGRDIPPPYLNETFTFGDVKTKTPAQVE